MVSGALTNFITKHICEIVQDNSSASLEEHTSAIKLQKHVAYGKRAEPFFLLKLTKDESFLSF